MLIEGFTSAAIIVCAGAALLFYQNRKLHHQFKGKYGVELKDAVDQVMLPISDRMIEEDADWSNIEYAMRNIMSDLWMWQGDQVKVLSIIHGAWLRGQSFVKKYGRSKAEVRTSIIDFLEQLAHNAPDRATACNTAKETLIDLGGYSETQVTGIVGLVSEWWSAWHKLFKQDSVLEKVREIRSNITDREAAPQSHAVLDDLEQAVLDYPQGIPEAVLKSAVMRLNEVGGTGRE